MFKFIVYLLIIIAAGQSQADTFTLPPADVDLVGRVMTVNASRDETILDIARRHDLGQEEILLANPAVDRWLP